MGKFIIRILISCPNLTDRKDSNLESNIELSQLTETQNSRNFEHVISVEIGKSPRSRDCHYVVKTDVHILSVCLEQLKKNIRHCNVLSTPYETAEPRIHACPVLQSVSDSSRSEIELRWISNRIPIESLAFESNRHSYYISYSIAV